MNLMRNLRFQLASKQVAQAALKLTNLFLVHEFLNAIFEMSIDPKIISFNDKFKLFIKILGIKY